MNQKQIQNIAFYILLTIIFLAPRLPQIDAFVTLDEPSWLSQGANFYYALGQREFENTVYEYQPAVTTMSIISVAMHIYFPEFLGFGQGYLDYEKGRLDPFMYDKGYDPLVLLTYSRLIQVFILLILFLTIFYLLQQLLPNWLAFFALGFASFDPFWLAHTRMMDHEAMVSSFVMISILALVIYFLQGRKIIFLILSGVAAGFAQLTKSSSIAMLVPIGLLFLIQMYQEREQGWAKVFLNYTKTFFIWFAFIAMTYFVFWPGMWVAPQKMLYEVFGNAFSFAFQGARLKVTEELDVAQFSLNTRFADIWEIARILLYRTTPFTWLGVLLIFTIRFITDTNLLRHLRLLLTLLLSTVLAFILLFGISQGRNSPHYILSSYLALNLLAGIGWFCAIQWISARYNQIKYLQIASLIIVFSFQSISAIANFPYYYTYRNPILYSAGWYNEHPQFPYCEGLEIAAQYLSQLPDAENSTAFVYYPRGCFSYFYSGTTTAFRPYYVDGNHAEDLLNYLTSADYLVVYFANQSQLNKYDAYLSILSTLKPIHEVWLNDYKYVQIYRIDTFSPEILKALADL
jgi:hypothetical protein